MEIDQLNDSPQATQSKILRGKNKVKAEYKIKDCYKQYVKESYIKHFKSAFLESRQPVLPYKVYRAILDHYFKKVVDFVIEDSGVFTLPMHLGSIHVEKKKMPIGLLHRTKNLKIDFGAFRKTGKKIYHLNEHRRGNRYKIRWNKKSTGSIPYKSIYSYIPTRTMKRRLAYILKNEFSKDYLEC